MNIGIMGIGKLGRPVAQAMRDRGHIVLGFDPYITQEGWFVSIDDLVRSTDIIFVAVQTPHQPQYEGITRLPKTNADFDYTFLKKAVKFVSDTAAKKQKPVELAIISTVLPGTTERELLPLTNQFVNVTYNPAFIAMGTVIEDFLDPEFVLIGGSKTGVIQKFYQTLTNAEQVVTDIRTAEAIKVSYNTFITMKTVLGNLWGEIAHKAHLNFADIHKAWSLADKRLISNSYLRAGMGDGGACHPRDNIALSWWADVLDLSHDLFKDLMLAREQHTEWLASLIPNGAVVFGTGFKPGSDITTGSPALLLGNMLREQRKVFDQAEDPQPGAFNFIATKHARYKEIQWPKGSTVLDPFRYIPDQEGVEVIRIGETR